MNDITDKFHKINVQNKKKDVENFYKSRVEKTKRCREILKSIDKFEEKENIKGGIHIISKEIERRIY